MNGDPAYLDGFQLVGKVGIPTFCSEFNGQQSAYGLFNEAKGGAGVFGGFVGAACSDASIGVAAVANLESLAQVSYLSTSTTLSNTAVYPLFTRGIGSDTTVIDCVVKLIQQLDYHRVGIFFTDETFSRSLAQGVVDLVPERVRTAVAYSAEESLGINRGPFETQNRYILDH